MHTLAEMAKALNRPAVYLHGLQSRFELPAFEGAAYLKLYSRIQADTSAEISLRREAARWGGQR